MHLLYARFWTKVMHDEGLINFDEPFTTLRNHGMILAPDGQKMSKSKGNTIEPDGLIEQGYGADSIRIMELFLGPWNQMANWSVDGLGGSFRFLQRLWTIALDTDHNEAKKTDDKLNVAINKAIEKVSADLESLNFNTAIASQMELVNELYKLKASHNYEPTEWQQALLNVVKLLAPFAPHMAEELWQELGQDGSVHTSAWPVHDPKYLVSDTVTVVVQVNGKVRANLEMPKDANQDQVSEAALKDENVAKFAGGKIKKTIYVPGKLINFVV
jgi:leucyl-tRNA synthetase